MQMRHDQVQNGYLYIEKLKLFNDYNVFDKNDIDRGLYHRIKMIQYNT